MNSKQKLIILGAGPLAGVIADIAEDLLKFNIVGFVIDQPPYVPGSKLLGKPILWIDDLDHMDCSYHAICSIYKRKKESIIDKVSSLGISFINIIHPSAVISRTVEIGQGNFITGGVQISANTKLGNHSIINRGVLVGHDVIIHDFSTLAPGANIASGVTIGSGTYVGMGANIVQNTNIGEGCFIGAGALVTRDIPDHVKVVGMPAQIIERDIGEDFL
jgi:acetyltransferase EpsM